MSFEAITYNVMLASPGDVSAERRIAREVLAEWNAVHSATKHLVLLPVGWETHASPTMGMEPQAIINQQILRNADLLIGIFWTRIGTATTAYASGTVEEIEEHMKAGKPTMLYFSDAPVPPHALDPAQYREVQEFRGRVQHRGLFETFASQDEFRAKFSRQLQLKINEPFPANVHWLSMLVVNTNIAIWISRRRIHHPNHIGIARCTRCLIHRSFPIVGGRDVRDSFDRCSFESDRRADSRARDRNDFGLARPFSRRAAHSLPSDRGFISSRSTFIRLPIALMRSRQVRRPARPGDDRSSPPHALNARIHHDLQSTARVEHNRRIAKVINAHQPVDQ